MLSWNWPIMVNIISGTRKPVSPTHRRSRSMELYIILRSTKKINRGMLLARLGSCHRPATIASNSFFLDTKEALALPPGLYSLKATLLLRSSEPRNRGTTHQTIDAADATAGGCRSIHRLTSLHMTVVQPPTRLPRSPPRGAPSPSNVLGPH